MFMVCLSSVLFTRVCWIKDFVLKDHETLKHFFFVCDVNIYSIYRLYISENNNCTHYVKTQFSTLCDNNILFL